MGQASHSCKGDISVCAHGADRDKWSPEGRKERIETGAITQSFFHILQRPKLSLAKAHTHAHRLDSAISLPLGRIFFPHSNSKNNQETLEETNAFLSARKVAKQRMFAIVAKCPQHAKHKDNQLLLFFVVVVFG